MQLTCKNSWCHQPFEITEDDLAFYQRIAPTFGDTRFPIPIPRLCPNCRMQRRLAFRNERHLYHGTCAISGQSILSAYSPDKPYRVVENALWWTDRLDPLSYGAPIDIENPLLPQIAVVMERGDWINLLNSNCENSDYTLNATYNKNSYMLFCASFNEDCYHCYWAQRNHSCCDCMGIRECEWCYDCTDCIRCHTVINSRNATVCSNGVSLVDCQNVHSATACVGLRNASYCFLNEVLTEPEWRAKDREWRTPEGRAQYQAAFDRLVEQCPRPWSQQRLTQECTGDYIYESERCTNCYDARNAQDCTHCQNIVEIKSSQDVSFFGFGTELLYECNNVGVNAYHCLFTNFSYGGRDLLYCNNAHYCESCFGCSNLHHRRFCILNQQYTEEDYNRLVPQLIASMQQESSWGEFFPVEMSPFAYNETVAQEHLPLERDEVLARGWKWRDANDEPPHVLKTVAAQDLPATEGANDTIVQWAVLCEVTKKPFRIVKQELAFYRSMQLPLPRLHPDERHRRRMALRNPRKLWKRNCAKCGKDMETTYAPERPEVVYCEECYLAEVY